MGNKPNLGDILHPKTIFKQTINLLRSLQGGHVRPRSERSPEIFHEGPDVKSSSALHFEPESRQWQRGFGLSQGVHPHRTGLALNLQDFTKKNVGNVV